MNDFSVSNRFVNENIGNHWQVDSSESSFTRLLEHIQVISLFYNGFCKAFIYFLVNPTETTNLPVNDEQKIRQYIQKRAEMKRNCDGMWSLRGIGGKSNSEIIALCKPLGFDVKSKTWRYEPESVKKVLRKYGIYD